MKKHILFILTAIYICSAFNTPHPLAADYRDTYIGNYYCNSNCESMKIQSNQQNNYSDTLTIKVTKDPNDSIVQLAIGKRIYQMKLKNNVLYPYPEGERRGGKFFGQDSISFVCSNGPGNLCNYFGKKK